MSHPFHHDSCLRRSPLRRFVSVRYCNNNVTLSRRMLVPDLLRVHCRSPMLAHPEALVIGHVIAVTCCIACN